MGRFSKHLKGIEYLDGFCDGDTVEVEITKIITSTDDAVLLRGSFGEEWVPLTSSGRYSHNWHEPA